MDEQRTVIGRPARQERSAPRTRPSIVVVATLALLAATGSIANQLVVPGLYAVILVAPLGLVYAAVTVPMLAARRRRAGAADPPLGARAETAAEGALPVQAIRWCLLIVLLVVAVVEGAVLLVEALVHLQDDVASPPAPGLLLLEGVGVAGLLLLVVAIPLAAVVVTLQLRDAALIAGEAAALRTSTGAHRWIRAGRVLARVDLLACAALLVEYVLTVVLLGFAP